jgi:hypothetical protein
MDWQKFLDETIQSTGVYHKEASNFLRLLLLWARRRKKVML